MGDYLSFSFSRSRKESIREVLAPVFSSGFFQPVAVGAIEAHSSGDHWFLTGYALEDFLGRLLARGISRPASVTLARSQDAELEAYQGQCADSLKQTVPLSRLCSPFEQVDSQLGVTVLEPKHLTEEVLDPVTRWSDRFQRAIFQVYGTVALALQKPVESTWNSAFRVVESPQVSGSTRAVPFLTLRIDAAASSEEWWISLASREPVWQRQGQALGGRVTADDADANLRELASFARLLIQGSPGGRLPAELHLEGSIFFREDARIRAAFQGLL